MNVHNLERMVQDPDTAREAPTIMRALVTSVYARPTEDGWDVELYGPLTSLVEFATTPDIKRPDDLGAPGRLLTVVAGVGFEPTTFRL